MAVFLGNKLKILLKVGGSLCSPDTLAGLKDEVAYLSGLASLIIVPGGGPFADTVRRAQADIGFGDSGAHWMAIAAMDQYGLLLEDLGFGKGLRDPDNLMQPTPSSEPKIILPFGYLVKEDPLPHSWNVSSDSIAAFLAGIVKPDLFVLLKAVDGLYENHGKDSQRLIPHAPCNEAAGSIVDSYFCKSLPEGLGAYIVNGKYPRRLRQLVEDHKLVGTLLGGGRAEGC